jgi:hypothetical protein
VRFVVLASLALALATVAAALASPQFSSTFEMTYLSPRAGASGGIHTLMTWSDPGEPGAKPKRVTQIRFGFHPGTRIDTRALPQCHASDTKVHIEGRAACPRNTRLGFARSEVKTTTTPVDKPRVTFFNAPRQIIVLVQVEGRVLAVYRDDVTRSTVTVNLGLPAGLSLLRLDARVTPHTGGHGKRRRVYFRNPPVCPAGGQWTTNVKFTYLDGSTNQLTAGTPCRG